MSSNVSVLYVSPASTCTSPSGVIDVIIYNNFCTWFYQTSGVSAAVFSRLTAHQLGEAAKLSLSNRDYRLALLVSQASSGSTTKNLIHKQLTDWLKTQVRLLTDPTPGTRNSPASLMLCIALLTRNNSHS